MLENLAVDTELRLLGLWKEVRPEGCFSALYEDISNYMILVIRRGFFFFCLFPRIVTSLHAMRKKRSFSSFPHL